MLFGIFEVSDEINVNLYCVSCVCMSSVSSSCSCCMAYVTSGCGRFQFSMDHAKTDSSSTFFEIHHFISPINVFFDCLAQFFSLFFLQYLLFPSGMIAKCLSIIMCFVLMAI